MALTPKQIKIIEEDAEKIDKESPPGTFDKDRYITQVMDINSRIEDRLLKFESEGITLLRELYPTLPNLNYVTIQLQKNKVKEMCDPMFAAINLTKDPELKILIVNCLKDLLDAYVHNSEEFKNRDSFDNPLH